LLILTFSRNSYTLTISQNNDNVEQYALDIIVQSAIMNSAKTYKKKGG